MTLEEKIARVIDPRVFLDDPAEEHRACSPHQVEVVRRKAILKARTILSLLPNTGEREQALEEAAINNLKSRLDTRLNNWLCEMKPDHDDSIVGFNEAWDIVNKVFKDIRALKSTPKPVGEDVVENVADELRNAHYAHIGRQIQLLWKDLPEYRRDRWRVLARVAANLLRKE